METLTQINVIDLDAFMNAMADRVVAKLKDQQQGVPENPEELVTYDEISAKYNYTHETISRKVNKRKIPVYRVGKKGAIKRKHIPEILK